MRRPTFLDENQTMSDPNRLRQQLDFMREIDKVKSVFRRNYLFDGSRLENDAEHSWHLAVMAVLFLEHADPPEVDLLRVIKMVLIHDLVEIDAGDTYAYDTEALVDQAERENRAANRIFGMLPADQRQEFRALWEEFDARHTPDARYAAALDRLQPMMHNYFTDGRVWIQNGITAEQVIARCSPIANGSPVLWEYAEGLIRDAVARGYLKG